ncbi:lytic polysaccharide monooxygenase [Saccharothrix carnea]|uniref:lytic polysaccharide monooxygenase n=1 Tax=Saccharothrix carnea TaxID=1280637 RepID=UPI001C62D5C9|nr:lytic polysaccharide monooxygenase [Saccharothrix carnea]
MASSRTYRDDATVGGPAASPPPDYKTEVNTSGCTGRHVVITIWKASHVDKKYFLCGDVDFG